MKAVPICIAALAALCAPAAAQVRYDAKLEQAVMQIIARKIGDIRPTLPADPPARRIVRDDVPRNGSSPPRHAAPAIESVPMPRPFHESWRFLRGATGMTSFTTGSIQSFSDGTELSPAERRKMANKTVSRVINF